MFQGYTKISKIADMFPSTDSAKNAVDMFLSTDRFK